MSNPNNMLSKCLSSQGITGPTYANNASYALHWPTFISVKSYQCVAKFYEDIKLSIAYFKDNSVHINIIIG